MKSKILAEARHRDYLSPNGNVKGYYKTLFTLFDKGKLNTLPW